MSKGLFWVNSHGKDEQADPDIMFWSDRMVFWGGAAENKLCIQPEYILISSHVNISKPRKFSYFYHKNVCCVYSLELPYRVDSNEYTQHTIIL